MKFLTPLYNSGVGFFWRLKATHEKALAINLNPSLEASMMGVHTLEAACVIRTALCVLHVLRSRSWAKVLPPIIGRVIIGMVKFVGRPFARHVEPNKVVLVVEPAVDLQRSVWTPAVAHWRPGPRANPASLAKPNAPRKDAGFRIVVQHFAQSRGRDNGTVSHLSAPDRWMVRGREALTRFAAPSF